MTDIERGAVTPDEMRGRAHSLRLAVRPKPYAEAMFPVDPELEVFRENVIAGAEALERLAALAEGEQEKALATVDERAADLGATAWSQYAVVRPNDGAALGPMPLGQALSLAKDIGGRVMVRRIIHGVWVSHG